MFDIRFPKRKDGLGQDEEWFEATIDGRRRRILIHDYAALYETPGLYEALVYDALNCASPARVVHVLDETLRDMPEDPEDLRVLDLGAGNGIVGEILRSIGVRRIVGLDLLEQAKMAAERDRPGVYDEYIAADLSSMEGRSAERLRANRLNTLVTVAALGFGDVPPLVFANAVNVVSETGWLALTIKEDFLDPGDSTGFGRLLRLMIDEQVMHVHALQRYRHRVSVEGEELFYVALVARKLHDIPDALIELVESTGAEDAAPEVSPTASLLRPPQ